MTATYEFSQKLRDERKSVYWSLGYVLFLSNQHLSFI